MNIAIIFLHGKINLCNIQAIIKILPTHVLNEIKKFYQNSASKVHNCYTISSELLQISSQNPYNENLNWQNELKESTTTFYIRNDTRLDLHAFLLCLILVLKTKRSVNYL